MQPKKVKINRLIHFQPDQPDLIHFEAIVRFSNGFVKASAVYGTSQEAIAAARWLIKHWTPRIENLPPEYQQSQAEADKLWATGEEVESSQEIEL